MKAIPRWMHGLAMRVVALGWAGCDGGGGNGDAGLPDADGEADPPGK